MIREVIFISFLLCGTASVADGKNCFASVICNLDNSKEHTPSWMQINPAPKCESGQHQHPLDKINAGYDASLQNFVQDLKKIASENCASCSSYRDAVNSSPLSHESSGLERCFLPVICSTPAASQTNWLQVHTSCNGRVSDLEYAEIFKNFSQKAASEYRKLVEDECNCATTASSIIDAIDSLENASFSLAAKNLKDCYAPVICSSEGKTDENWLKVYPPQNCTDTPQITTIESAKAKQTFDDSLQKAIQAFKDLAISGCDCDITTAAPTASSG